jgi:hypothetical protein
VAPLLWVLVFVIEPAVDDQGRVYVSGGPSSGLVGIAFGLVPPVRP